MYIEIKNNVHNTYIQWLTYSKLQHTKDTIYLEVYIVGYSFFLSCNVLIMFFWKPAFRSPLERQCCHAAAQSLHKHPGNCNLTIANRCLFANVVKTWFCCPTTPMSNCFCVYVLYTTPNKNVGDCSSFRTTIKYRYWTETMIPSLYIFISFNPYWYQFLDGRTMADRRSFIMRAFTVEMWHVHLLVWVPISCHRYEWYHD